MPYTVGVDFRSKYLKIDDKNIKIALFDCKGQTKYRSIANLYLKGIKY